MTEDSLKIMAMLADYADELKQKESKSKAELVMYQDILNDKDENHQKAEKLYKRRIENYKNECISLAQNLCKQLQLPENEITDWITCFENVFK